MSVIFQLFLSSVVYSSLTQTISSDSDSCYMHQYLRKKVDQEFEQKNTRFWEFNEESNTWGEVKLPYDLTSCINGNCTVVRTIQDPRKEAKDDHDEDGEMNGSDQRDSLEERKKKNNDGGNKQDKIISYPFLPVRKRISLTKMSEKSIWVTGESGFIYQRFWNGVQWVVVPHALPVSDGYAVAVFLVNQNYLALSEAGQLYLMQLNEESQPIWVEIVLGSYEGTTSKVETVQSSTVHLSSGIVSNDGKRMYFCTNDGILLELLQIDPPSWTNHGRPPGANIAAITDAATVRPGLLFIVSLAGDLYEYDPTSKPPWRKHIRQEGLPKDTALSSSRTCTSHGIVGPHSISLFFLTKGGELIERRMHQRKWKWVVHGNPKGHVLTSITCIPQDEPNETSNSLFVTTAAGFVFQYHIQKHPGSSEDHEIEENWLNHNHPPHARAARGISGIHFQTGRMIFPLDDGRLAELHLSGLGGESLGPNTPTSTRRKSLLKYVWSILDAPESEGWNAEYCTAGRGPSNCMSGTKDETGEVLFPRWRKDGKTQQSYLIPSMPDIGSLSGLGQDYKRIKEVFRLRVMQEGKSFFLITDKGVTFECVNNDNTWFWLRHEHSTRIEGVVGKYNGSLFFVDDSGSVLIRERSGTGSDLAWINCTSMRRGEPVVGGPPWDGMLGRESKVLPEDAIFFVSKSGRLLEFSVALRKFKWKDCENPPGTRIATIVDQEAFRENIVFVIGNNGRLYQYNKVSGLWHQHYQSQHLVLSRSPGTSTRPSALSLGGSLFMLSEDGGLVEYQWSPTGGWNWVEHGQPRTNVTLVGAPGPCFGGTELFLIGSDGNVYLRYLDRGEWKWGDCRFPDIAPEFDGNEGELANEKSRGIDKNCNPKVSSIRPIAFSEDSVIFELQDVGTNEPNGREDLDMVAYDLYSDELMLGVLLDFMVIG
ncbi:hypothetical protein OROHE_024181 [Orobanche hederae]